MCQAASAHLSALQGTAALTLTMLMACPLPADPLPAEGICFSPVSAAQQPHFRLSCLQLLQQLAQCTPAGLGYDAAAHASPLLGHSACGADICCHAGNLTLSLLYAPCRPQLHCFCLSCSAPGAFEITGIQLGVMRHRQGPERGQPEVLWLSSLP